MIATLLALGITLIFLAVLCGLVYAGVYAAAFLIPLVLVGGFAYTIYCVTAHTITLAKRKDK